MRALTNELGVSADVAAANAAYVAGLALPAASPDQARLFFGVVARVAERDEPVEDHTAAA